MITLGGKMEEYLNTGVMFGRPRTVAVCHYTPSISTFCIISRQDDALTKATTATYVYLCRNAFMRRSDVFTAQERAHSLDGLIQLHHR